ncbi:MAG: phosphoadenosine phosphosulfate reductase family protein [Methylococcales bacterium]
MKHLIDKAVTILRDLMINHSICAATSYGRDSTCVLILVLKAARELKAEGIAFHPIYVMTSDTGIELPNMTMLVYSELEKVKSFAKRYDLPVFVEIGKPYLASSWVMRIIGQGKLPVWPGCSQDCTFEYKIQVQNRLRKSVLKNAKNTSNVTPVIVTGVRFAESASRASKMRKRGDNAEDLILNKNGDLYLSPISNWQDDDVWEFIALAGQMQAFDNYSDLEDTKKLYAAATPASCPVIGDAILGEQKKQRGGCQARFGCVFCNAISRDKSLESMIENDPDNRFMLNLNMIQRWLSASRYNYEDRSWLPRGINDAGYIAVHPDTLGAGQIENLFKWVVTADVIEKEEAERLGISPRFEIIDIEKLIGVDASWSQLGFFPPFHALDLYKRISEQGERYYAPAIDDFPRIPMPAARYVHIGDDWRDAAIKDSHLVPVSEALFAGGLNSISEMMIDNDALCPSSEVGKYISVDKEGAELFLEFESDRLISEFNNWENHVSPDITEGYKTYIRYGILKMSGAHVNTTHKILRRTYFRQLLGLTGKKPDIEAFLQNSISESEMNSILKEHKNDVNTELEAEKAYAFWLTTGAGQVCSRILEEREIRLTLTHAIKDRISSDAYIEYANELGLTSSFDGVNFKDKAKSATRTISVLTKKYSADAIIMNMITDITSTLYKEALRAIDVRQVNASFGLGLSVVLFDSKTKESTFSSLSKKWSKVLSVNNYGEQMSLFDSFPHVLTKSTQNNENLTPYAH